VVRLLFDEHISPRVAEAVRRRNPRLIVHPLARWRGGELLGRSDAACLEQAALEGLTLVTFDRRTIPPLLKQWAEEGRSHGGVIFVDEKTISPADIGSLARALLDLAARTAAWKWSDRVCFLTP
jgi:hypothetical protein